MMNYSVFQIVGAWNPRGELHHPTPVLRYSEEPDRSSKNPALRSTSEPASSANAQVTHTFEMSQALPK